MLKQVTKQLALQGVRNFSVSQQVSAKINPNWSSIFFRLQLDKRFT